MADVIFDKQDQLNRVQEMLVPGEDLLCVLDCKGRGSGFLGVTDKRVIIRDDGFAKFKRSIISVPYSRLHAVGVDSERSFFGRGASSLSFSAGDDDWELEFKGADKAHAAYTAIMTHWLVT